MAKYPGSKSAEFISESFIIRALASAVSPRDGDEDGARAPFRKLMKYEIVQACFLFVCNSALYPEVQKDSDKTIPTIL